MTPGAFDDAGSVHSPLSVENGAVDYKKNAHSEDSENHKEKFHEKPFRCPPPGLHYFRKDVNFRKLLINNDGRRGGNRTHNPRLRRPVLYPIELLARVFHCSVEWPQSASANAARAFFSPAL